MKEHRLLQIPCIVAAKQQVKEVDDEFTGVTYLETIKLCVLTVSKDNEIDIWNLT